MKFSGFCSIFTLLVLFTRYDVIQCLDSPCGPWVSFKDEKCFGILDDTVRTFADAEKECEKLENSPTLAVIHSAEEQEFLSNFLFKTSKKVENFWLGAKVVNSKVAWIDNSDMGYTNWDTRNLAPRNKPNYCLQMEADESVLGKWIDQPCEKNNLVVCQKIQTLTLEKLHKIVLDSQKEINTLKQMFEEEKSVIKNIHEQNTIPIGFTYTQLPNQKSPTEIWPSMKWTDVSATYGGVFFRVEGAGSEPFGHTQKENSPRLIEIENKGSSAIADHYNSSNYAVNVNSATQWIYTGDYARNFPMYLRFNTSGGEVRPKNMAIRVWQRSG